MYLAGELYSQQSTDRLQPTVKIFSIVTMHKFLPNLHSKNAAALSWSSLKEPEILDCLTTTAEDSQAQSCFHLCAAISTRPIAQLLWQRRREGGSTLSRNSFLIIM